MPIVAFYQTRRGAHVMEPIHTVERALHLLANHRGPVEIKHNGEVIGSRERFDGADDKRVRWLWSLDADAFKGVQS